MQHALNFNLVLGKNVLKNLELFVLFSTLYQSNENGYDDYMCKCTKIINSTKIHHSKITEKI